MRFIPIDVDLTKDWEFRHIAVAWADVVERREDFRVGGVFLHRKSKELFADFSLMEDIHAGSEVSNQAEVFV